MSRRLRLPPLPSGETWKNYFGRSVLAAPLDATANRVFNGRTFLTNPKHTNEFVRALKLRPEDVILEQWPGPGQLTRSLVYGGNDIDVEKVKQAWAEGLKEQKPEDYDVAMARVKKGKSGMKSKALFGSRKGDAVFPAWGASFVKDDLISPEEANEIGGVSDYPVPRHVVSLESSSDTMVAGLGLRQEHALSPFEYKTLERLQGNDSRFDLGSDPTASTPAAKVRPSDYESNLSFVVASPYQWRLLPETLMADEVKDLIDEAGEGDALEGSKGMRKWMAEPPNLIHVCQVPDGQAGEGLVGQWIMSVVGAAEDAPHWIWKWGRIRMAFLTGRTLYDVGLFFFGVVHGKYGGLISCGRN
jgi:hypothetical protein